MSCDCPNVMQDKLHGTNNRVFNPTAEEKTYRCTVCNKEKSKGGGSPEEHQDRRSQRGDKDLRHRRASGAKQPGRRDDQGQNKPGRRPDEHGPPLGGEGRKHDAE